MNPILTANPPMIQELTCQSAQEIDQLLQQMIDQQSLKALDIARTHSSHFTPEDLLNPHDFPPLFQDPIFNYEDGLTSGLLAAQAAIRALLKDRSQKTD